MSMAIIGCGYVADFYMKTLHLHPRLELLGATDRNPARAERFARFHRTHAYRSTAELLEDRRVELVVNLTNPRSHYEVSKACLEAGKHVYSEKPLGMSMAQAKELVALAERKGLRISSAPSRLLGETAQTMWKALREGVIGRPWLAYAELDDGLVHGMPYETWISDSGAPWPYKDEFEVGCTLEHAGYVLTCLAAFFGPARSVTAFSSVLILDKDTAVPIEGMAPDFSVGCIQFASGVVARMTNSIVASHDHSIRIFGESGVLSTPDCWVPRSPVYVQRRIQLRRKVMLTPWRATLPFPTSKEIPPRVRGFKKVDYLLGVKELAEAIRNDRPSRLSPQFCLHVNELTLAVQESLDTQGPVRLETTFDPIDPMPWAR